MEKVTLSFWGRKNELEIIFDCYEGDEVTEEQRQALAQFLPAAEKLIDSAREEVEEYIENDDMMEEEQVDNIFDYVTPQSIFVKRMKKRIIGLMCSYTLDEEDGFAICFEDENLKRVGSQNIIL